MSDIIERAESLSYTQAPQADLWVLLTVPYPLWAGLIAELKSARAENDRLKSGESGVEKCLIPFCPWHERDRDQ